MLDYLLMLLVEWIVTKRKISVVANMTITEKQTINNCEWFLSINNTFINNQLTTVRRTK